MVVRTSKIAVFITIIFFSSCVSKNLYFTDSGKIQGLDTYQRGNIWKEINQIDSLANLILDTIPQLPHKYEVWFYSLNQTHGVNYFEIDCFDDSTGVKLSHGWPGRGFQKSLFPKTTIKKYLNDKESFRNKFSYEAGACYSDFRYIVCKENWSMTFCGVYYIMHKDQNYGQDSFINYILTSRKNDYN